MGAHELPMKTLSKNRKTLLSQVSTRVMQAEIRILR